MEINRIQNHQIQQKLHPNQQTRVNLELPNDSVSFRSKEKKQSPTLLDKVKAFFKPSKQEKTHYNSINKGFEEHFYTLKDSIVSEISLTPKQKRILDKKIKAFEEYKGTLSQTQLEELEKISMAC